jgi:hypothetical protein
MAGYNEAPFSVTYSVKNKDGFPMLISTRASEFEELLGNITNIDLFLLNNDYEPDIRRAGFPPKKEKEYVPNRVCPKCGSPLIQSVTKTGKNLIKCSTAKYFNGVASGCDFVEWLDDKPMASNPNQTVGGNAQPSTNAPATQAQKNLIQKNWPELFDPNLNFNAASQIIQANKNW